MFDDLLQSIFTHGARYKAAKARVEECDKFMNDYYHIIEFVKLSGPEMMALTKKLKEITRERRELKQVVSRYQSFFDRVKTEQITSAVNASVNAGQDVDKISKEAHNVFESLKGNRNEVQF